jgi:hypothetical protein
MLELGQKSGGYMLQKYKKYVQKYKHTLVTQVIAK